MSIVIDSSALNAIFAVPQSEGVYEDPTLSYLREMGARRPLLLLAFAPKAAGTFLREAAVRATGGQLVRLVHAQGGRDGTLYLPYLLSYYLPENAPAIVSHVHMQALPANRNFIDALGLKPVIMLRDLSDMLASYLDMLERDPIARAEGLNCQVPSTFLHMTREERLDFMIDVIAPWYASYFATWNDFADEEPETVCVLRYNDFRADPVQALWTALAHADFTVPRERCEAALNAVWEERGQFRFNQGIAGRGRRTFSPARIDRLRKLLSFYPQLRPWMPELLSEKQAAAI